MKNGSSIENEGVCRVVQEYRMCGQRLLQIDFVSLQEYLSLLEQIAKLINESAVPSLVYLAAAVSDFYLLEEDMAEHKIQSREHGNLTISLVPVPKKLGLLRHEWLPSCFCISFKV